ncbi:MAG: GNAT family N-acetyltransferase [Treponema sp.]|nr:GNAT family N-acetyltransferase [Candidatus Treponema scatequi]
MDISIEDNLTFEEYKDLRNTTSWTKLTDTQIEKLIKNSAFKVRAKVDGKTVGMGRVLFDFGYTAYLADIIVAPEAQGKGIGRKIVERLIQLVKENVAVTDFLNFSLMAAQGKSGFYEKLGFTKREEANGYGMVMRINE